MLFSAARNQAESDLAAAAVPSPKVDAELLLAHVIGASRSDVQLGVLLGRELQPAQHQAYQELVARRARRIPLQHLTGTAYFRHLQLQVGPGVFIPRPETESVVQLALDFIGEQQGARLVDLCSGSGAIAAALATELSAPRVWAVELSDQAIGYTRQNCEPLGISVLHADAGNLPAGLLPEGGIDAVVSNPPYIPPSAVPREQEVREHDPQMALYGLGEDGLQVPRAVSAQALELLRPGGLFVMEHAEVQAATAASMLRATGFTEVTGHRDLNGRPRATSGVAPEK
ncbi:peptide chain release factor N(5)-glutamine methyltransferase [Glutamicibacter creatinolyticus]|uniref:peptide chain release factor N(5)-glutamine methyltransferase n=1 Tax=Glutamicibacter creatinolyticus TaxID=162496 RepID=UPI0037C0BFE5